MIVMLANNTGRKVKDLARRFPGQTGHLYGPGTQRGPLSDFPYALDNNRFGCFKNGTEWDEAKWLSLLSWAASADHKPRWALVPDVVGNRLETLEDWRKYRDVVKSFGFKLAFAVQDGMRASDVPYDADVVFVGGTTDWKWATVHGWCRDFSRIHVGRVNTYGKLHVCRDAGAESTDGTGFPRGCQRQWRGLVQFHEEQAGNKTREMQLCL